MTPNLRISFKEWQRKRLFEMPPSDIAKFGKELVMSSSTEKDACPTQDRTPVGGGCYPQLDVAVKLVLQTTRGHGDYEAITDGGRLLKESEEEKEATKAEVWQMKDEKEAAKAKCKDDIPNYPSDDEGATVNGLTKQTKIRMQLGPPMVLLQVGYIPRAEQGYSIQHLQMLHSLLLHPPNLGVFKVLEFCRFGHGRLGYGHVYLCWDNCIHPIGESIGSSSCWARDQIEDFRGHARNGGVLLASITPLDVALSVLFHGGPIVPLRISTMRQGTSPLCDCHTHLLVVKPICIVPPCRLST
ncbi:hypothetical protein AAG906_037027 [Vitis piasezkii]